MPEINQNETLKLFGGKNFSVQALPSVGSIFWHFLAITPPGLAFFVNFALTFTGIKKDLQKKLAFVQSYTSEVL